MKKISLLILGSAFALSTTTLVSCSNANQEAAAADKAKVEEFLQKAVATDRFELMAGMMAADQGKEVDAYGQKLVHIHSRTSPVLESMAKQRRVELPAEMPTDKKAIVDSLEVKKGEEFDQTFTEAQLEVQQETVALYEKADKEVEDKEIQAFIDQVLPVMKEHLAELKELKNAVASK
ncbi:MAG: DUF4142 domain-containing protein [Rufibacter sp.]